MLRVNDLLVQFNFITFKHIFRQLNYEVDRFSKKETRLQEGLLYFEEFKEKIVVSEGSYSTY